MVLERFHLLAPILGAFFYFFNGNVPLWWPWWPSGLVFHSQAALILDIGLLYALVGISVTIYTMVGERAFGISRFGEVTFGIKT